MKFNIDGELHGAVVRVLSDLLRDCYNVTEDSEGNRTIKLSSYNFACLRSVLSDLTTRRRNG